MSLPTPSVEYAQLSPMLIVFGAAVLGVLVEAFVPRRMRYPTQLVLSLGATLAALVAVAILGSHLRSPGKTVVAGSIAVDGPALLLQGTLLVVGLLGIALIAQRQIVPAKVAVAAGSRASGFDAFTPQAAAIPDSPAENEAGRLGVSQTEAFPLTLFALGGMLVFPAADDLLTMFIALEVLSLPLYLLCGLARRRRLLSQEAALKYFLLGAFSSAFFLYGIALLYGYAGTLSLRGISDAVIMGGRDDSLALVGVALLSVGLLFKVGAVPFHSWIPDVYQGAPTPITGFMAAATKIAAFGAMLRVFYVALPGLIAAWRPALSAVAIVTMLAGAALTISQTNIKRLLAYSSVANVGVILTGLVAADHAGVSSTMFYLVAYAVSTVGAFAIVGMIRDAPGEEDTDMAHWSGLGRRSPLAGGVLSLFLLAMAGIPLTSGFVSKFAVFSAAMAGGAGALVAAGVISGVIVTFAYMKVIVVMFFTDPGVDTPRVSSAGWLSTAVVFVGAALTVLLGIAPQPLLELALRAEAFLP